MTAGCSTTGNGWWSVTESLPVVLDGKVVGYTQGVDVVITDETAANLLRGGPINVSIGPLDATPVVSGLAIRRKVDQCHPAIGYHATPHVGCILR